MNRSGLFFAGMNVLCLMLLMWSDSSYSEELFWDGTPMDILLRTGVERTVRFPTAIRDVRLPESAVRQLRTQSAGHAVHWLAHADFAPLRVIVHTVEDDVYFVDLQASAEGPVTPLQIYRSHADTAAYMQSEARAQTAAQTPAELQLTRFAARTLYAPQRLLPEGRAIRRYPVATYPKDFPLLRGVDFHYSLIAGWRGYGLYVTAVLVENRSALRMPLSPHLFPHTRIRGGWRASTFHHRWLEPADSAHDADTTVLYLVSEEPFHRSLSALGQSVGARR